MLVARVCREPKVQPETNREHLVVVTSRSRQGRINKAAVLVKRTTDKRPRTQCVQRGLAPPLTPLQHADFAGEPVWSFRKITIFGWLKLAYLNTH